MRNRMWPEFFADARGEDEAVNALQGRRQHAGVESAR